MVGTARYASINSHLGIELSRRDDLESLGYCMVYLFKGFLPWQGIKANNKQEKYNKILEKKEFSVYLHYVRNMKFDEKPDYHFIRRLFKELFFKKDLQWDYLFDWVMPNPQNPADFIRTYVRDEGKPEEKITITFNNQPPQPPQEILENEDVRGENNNNNFLENKTPKDAFMNSPKLISQEAEDQHSNYQANENEQQQDYQQQGQQNGDILNDSKENNIDQLQNKSLFD
ncbi:Protein kinase-like domain [Pseudocohnilembus persalinus]|uniref:Protein kinase-like domain n=1 Tax=Pseudocohnilembus persalinus TaxID=266149 RepID=A0A0V0R5V9_PSEPJ|nr:Protein kinase-like domain [Pseudocohnilembus persalinus]|eukprot:KRX09863.1 Protein kinase-like domain [Pseudocohnilembus persalinus]